MSVSNSDYLDPDSFTNEILTRRTDKPVTQPSMDISRTLAPKSDH